MPYGSPYCHRQPPQVADVDKYNFCRGSHAEANAIRKARRYLIPIKGASLYVTLEPCYVCVWHLSGAQIENVFYELPYDYKGTIQETYKQKALEESNFQEYSQFTISPETLDYVLPRLEETTSTQRLDTAT